MVWVFIFREISEVRGWSDLEWNKLQKSAPLRRHQSVGISLAFFMNPEKRSSLLQEAVALTLSACCRKGPEQRICREAEAATPLVPPRPTQLPTTASTASRHTCSAHPGTGSWPPLSSWLPHPGLGSALGSPASVCTGTWGPDRLRHAGPCVLSLAGGPVPAPAPRLGPWSPGQHFGWVSPGPVGSPGGFEQR